jgi:hypothetical protein
MPALPFSQVGVQAAAFLGLAEPAAELIDQLWMSGPLVPAHRLIMPVQIVGDDVGCIFRDGLGGNGDSFYCQSHLRHNYTNLRWGETRILWINMPPTI